MTSKKRLGITMGDPLGIGPEVVVKALQLWHDQAPRSSIQWVVWGDLPRLESMREMMKLTVPWTITDSARKLDDLKDAPIVIIPGPAVDGPWGQISARAGQASYAYIVSAIEAALARQVAGVVTAPIHKEAIHQAGIRQAGHTEIFADLCGAPAVAMMLVGGGLRVAHVSTHLSLEQALGRVTRERIETVAQLALEVLPKFGLSRFTVAVAGLNPHNGEHGLFGDTEQRVIKPAVDRLQDRGLSVVGPIPADTVFARARQGEFDAVVAMYHDQGHIPVKLMAFDEAVNLTLGLPIVRTSVDHGTGFDIAGQGIANAASMLSAMHVAESLIA